MADSTKDGEEPASDSTQSHEQVEEKEKEKSRIAADKIFKKELYHYLRWALSAGAPGPGIPETMEILGRAETVKRIQEARALTPDPTSRVTRRPKGEDQGKDKEDLSWMGTLAPRS